jgi:hypothetical protein
MKRSSTIARLVDEPQHAEQENHYHHYHVSSSKWNYQDDILATSMMLATISDDKDRRYQTRRSGSMGSTVSGGSMSRCSSRSSLSGWGSATSRKSYKVDLCSLADRDSPTSQYNVKSASASSSGSHGACDELLTVVPDTVEEAWGFFVDSNI